MQATCWSTRAGPIVSVARTRRWTRSRGHVPGARNRPFATNLVDQRFKPPVVLAAEFRELLGEHPADHTIVMCGSGVTACHHLLAMERAGFKGARLFTGSWSGWIADRYARSCDGRCLKRAREGSRRALFAKRSHQRLQACLRVPRKPALDEVIDADAFGIQSGHQVCARDRARLQHWLPRELQQLFEPGARAHGDVVDIT